MLYREINQVLSEGRNKKEKLNLLWSILNAIQYAILDNDLTPVCGNFSNEHLTNFQDYIIEQLKLEEQSNVS